MRNKDTGEFELVVGDRQLLSAFFIGVLLLAVVFAMGYVLGQSSPKSAKVAPDTAAVPASTVADNRPPAAVATPLPRSSEPATTPAQADTAEPAAAQPMETPPQPTTVPARDSVAPAAPPKAQIAPDPANATYWQVLATGSQNSADAMSQTLKGRGFPVSTRSGPNNLTLVWVGPYTDKESLTRAKKQLEDAGINNLYKKP
jgi:cell division septation protein DedD